MARRHGAPLACLTAAIIVGAMAAPLPAEARNASASYANGAGVRTIIVIQRLPVVYDPAPYSVYIGPGISGGTYAAPPRWYGGDPADYRNVPVGQPDRQGCYGGREQVVAPDGRLIWVPDLTCIGGAG